jgi:putative ABC transport system permease protein
VIRSLCTRLYRLVCRLAPLGLEPIWLDRMAEDFDARAEEANRRGSWSVLALTAAALVNLAAESVGRTVSLARRRTRSGRHEGGGGVVMEAMRRDVRHALRSLARGPGFASVIVLTLALAIGANTTLFSVVHGVLLRPMPYDDSQDLYQITIHYEDGSRDPYSSYADFTDQRERLSSAEVIAAFYQDSPTFTAEGADPLRLGGLVVSSGFFEALRLSPALGTLFSADDILQRNADVVVIGHGLWQGAFGGDPDVIGRSIELNGQTRTVIGVGPEAFPTRLPGVGPSQVYLPLPYEVSEEPPGRGSHNLNTLVRLAPDVTHERAEGELDAIMLSLRQDYPGTNQGKGADLEAFHDLVVADVRGALRLLLGCVGLVLLIAVANVTSVLLGRMADREREIGLRTALGAARGRIYGQLVTEGVVLASLGGVVGVGLAFLGTDGLVDWIGGTLPRAEAISVDPAVLLVTTGVTLGAGLLMGLVPAWSVGRTELTQALRSGGTGRSTAGRRRQRMRGALVVTQVGLCLTLLTGSGLLIRTLAELSRVEIGVNASVLSFGVHLPDARYPEWADHDAFHAALEERLKRIPGVVEVGSINGVPLSTTGICGTLYAEEDPTRFEGGDTCAQVRSASSDYFRIMGIDLLEGRIFGEADDPEADLIVINQATADLLWPGENPLGRRIMTGFRGVMFEVIGVVENVKQFELNEEPLYQTYIWEKRWRRTARNMVVELTGDAEAVLGPIRDAVWSIDPQLPLYSVTTIGELRRARLAEHRFRTILLAAMSGLALVLAVVGIYGVVSYSVSQREREMAIRISIGAKATEVRRMVLGQALRLVAGGLVLGTVGAVLFARSLATFLYRVEQNDPTTMLGVALLLLTAAVAAAIIPARRATRVDPMLVLRQD